MGRGLAPLLCLGLVLLGGLGAFWLYTTFRGRDAEDEEDKAGAAETAQKKKKSRRGKKSA